MTSPTPDRLEFIPTDVSPPDGFAHVHSDGYTTRARSYGDWLAAIKKHELDNDRELAPDWIEDVEDRFCRTLPPGWCRYRRTGSEPELHLDKRGGLGVETVANAARVFVAFIRSGAAIVEQEEAERRGKICAGCYARDQVTGCAPCHGLSNLVADVAGAQKTSSDGVLEGKACAVCRCPARANIWIPVETSRVGVTEEMMGLFPKSFCWKYKQLKELEEHELQND